MTNEERARAFAMRLEGRTWAEIGDELHYAPQTVSVDMYAALERTPRAPTILYPAIRKHIGRHYGGSVAAYAKEIAVSPSRLRRVLFCGDTPPDSMVKKITEDMGMEAKEVFAREDLQGLQRDI